MISYEVFKVRLAKKIYDTNTEKKKMTSYWHRFDKNVKFLEYIYNLLVLAETYPYSYNGKRITVPKKESKFLKKCFS